MVCQGNVSGSGTVGQLSGAGSRWQASRSPNHTTSGMNRQRGKLVQTRHETYLTTRRLLCVAYSTSTPTWRRSVTVISVNWKKVSKIRVFIHGTQKQQSQCAAVLLKQQCFQMSLWKCRSVVPQQGSFREAFQLPRNCQRAACVFSAQHTSTSRHCSRFKSKLKTYLFNQLSTFSNLLSFYFGFMLRMIIV